jgi:NhaP-type Na+/H+ or K+/H+ antiporter
VEGTQAAFTLSLALAVGVLAQSVARHLRVPGIVLLLLAGCVLGPDGFAWIDPRSLGDGLLVIVDLAVAVILFEGGLNLQIGRLRREQVVIRRLITWGALITLVGGSLAAYALLGWNWRPAVLFGSLVVVTGPTVIGPLIAQLRLRTRPATVLEAEGVLIDPVGAILAVLVLEIVLAPGASTLATGVIDFVFRIGFGAFAGAAAGFLIASIFQARRLIPEGHENVLVLASVLFLYEICEKNMPLSGLLAVTIAGVVVGNRETRIDRNLREFKEEITLLLIGLLFVMLAADVRIDQVRELGWPGLAVVGVLVFVVRPLGVCLSAVGSDLSWRERAFIAWVAPRGIVAAAIASVVAGTMEAEGLVGGGELRALVFLTIATTVVLAGLTATPIASLLKVRLPGRDTVAILGAQGLGFSLARELGRAGIPTVFVDSNPQSVRRAEEEGFRVVFGNALQERTFSRARFYRVREVAALTGNSMLNGVYVTRCQELFHIDAAYVSLVPGSTGVGRELVEAGEALEIFDSTHDVERWDVRERNGDVKVEYRVFNPVEDAETPPSAIADRVVEYYVILTVSRGSATKVMSATFELRPGDIAAIAIHQPDRDEADRLLVHSGWGESIELPEPEESAPQEDG